MTGLRIQLRHLPLFPALAVVMLGLPTVAHAQASASDVVQDEVIVTGAAVDGDPTAPAIAGASGRLAVNLASGTGNQEINSALVAVGDVALGTSVVRQVTGLADPRDRATHVALEGDAFAGSTGLVSVNITAGIQNQAANIAVLSIGNHGAISDQLLEQTRAPTEPNGSSGGAGLRNDVVEVSDDAFRNSSGLIQVNLIGGERNSSANTFALSVLGEGTP